MQAKASPTSLPQDVKAPTSKAANTSKLMPYIWYALPFVLSIWALFKPTYFWGLHYGAFLNDGLGLIIVAAATGIALIPWGKALLKQENSLEKIGNAFFPFIAFAFIAASLLAYYAYKTPIITDIYGDARNVLKNLNKEYLNPAANYWEGVLNPNIFSAKNGSELTFSIIGIMKQKTAWDFEYCFRVFTAFAGFAYVLVALSAIYTLIKGGVQKIAGYILVLGAGILAVFHGQCEVYALPILFHTLFLWFAFWQVQKPAIWKLILLPFLWFLSMKSHSTAILLLPALLIAVANTFQDKNTLATRFITWKGLFSFILLPGSLLFLYLYFIKLGSYKLPHINQGPYDVFKTLFLPLVPDKAPFDKYTLFKPVHIWDWMNAWFHTTVAVWMLVLGLLIFGRKQIAWAKTEVKIASLSIGIFAAFFFVANTTLSMPRDWDLLSVAGAVILLAGAVLVLNADFFQKEGAWKQQLIPYSLGMAVLGLPISMVNNNVLATTYRLENVGKQVYLHYYGGSSYILNVAAKIGNPSVEEELSRRKRALELVLPVAHKRVPQDPMLLHLLENAAMMSVEVKDYPSTVYYMNLAIEKGGGSAQGYYYLAYAYYAQKDYANANMVLKQIVPALANMKEVQELALASFLETKDYASAQMAAKNLLAIDPNNAQASALLSQLEGGAK